MIDSPHHAPDTCNATPTDDRPILLIDGVCNLCNGIAQFVIRRDPSPGRFRFAALQSNCGQQLLREHGLPTEDLGTFVMIDGKRVFVRSTAGLHVLRGLGLPWSLLYVLIIVPRPMRDVVYRWIARNRYRWFGKQESCMVPTPDIRSRFLD
jgi:predicted DCC family thiol-disulfide oxidoreductase YuxK